MKILPMFDRVLLKRDPLKQSSGGIIIPETQVSQRSDRAKVIAVGRGKRLASGATAEPSVRKGDVVLFDKNRGMPVNVDGEDLLMVFEDDILAVCE